MHGERHLDKIGVAGAILATLCYIGPADVAFVVSAAGLAFILNDAVLMPVAIVFLAITLVGLALGWRRHRRVGAPSRRGRRGDGLRLHVRRDLRPFAYVGIAGLVAASVLNVACSTWASSARASAGCAAGSGGARPRQRSEAMS